MLLNHKADPDIPDDDGLTPLHLAAFNGSYLSMSFLLNANANFRIKTKDGINCLHYAAYNGHLSTVHLLMEQDAPVDCLDDRNVTPLHYAAACNHWDIIRYLLFKGADVDFANKEGLLILPFFSFLFSLPPLINPFPFSRFDPPFLRCQKWCFGRRHNFDRKWG